eukprot:CAMPEP_0205829988 /NCGR_PEP_ID=MMETSP0206-20130828/39800_1 /ASSEMBLY_ACC=CAM_ASM_000279 /TAXON_ID=36767 /ORGANISM="Euplotes focardii, Strain TN1" /LENGTH=109 /DNA_ID=CAMNT_0053133217 /DNA_START=153 /DNA_END=482 /DNA_ORIENTATION=+
MTPIDIAYQETNLSPFENSRSGLKKKDTLKPYNKYKITEKESSNRSSNQLIEDEFLHDRHTSKFRRHRKQHWTKTLNTGKWTPIPEISKEKKFSFMDEDLKPKRKEKSG